MQKPVRTLFVTTLAIAACAAASGCNSDNAENEIEGAIQAPELQHSFQEATCQSVGTLNLIGASVRTSYQFAGDQVTRTVDVYSSANCVDLAATIAYTGTFQKGSSVGNNTDQINWNYTGVAVTAQNDTGQKVLASTQFCGTSQWTVGTAVNLTTATRNATCPLDTLPEMQYDIYSVSNNTLYLGQGGASTSESQRPTALNQQDGYTQQ